MPTQAETLKVFNAVIYPLQRHWGVELDADTINDFVEELAAFDENSLQNGMKKIKREHKKRPTLAHIYGACREYLPERKSAPPSKKPMFHCIEHAETKHSITAREILSSPVGQLALELHVGRELLNEYEVSGRTEFDDRSVHKFKSALDNSTLALSEARNIKNPSLEYFEGIFQSMMDREKHLYSRFYKVSA